MSLPAIAINVFAQAGAVNAPFMSGVFFRKGDVPAGSQIISDLGTFQCDIKATWPDGSAKAGVVGGMITLASTAMVPVNLMIGTPTGGLALTPAAIKNTANSDVVVDCGTFGSVTWTGAEWDTPFETWTAGPQMSNFRYRKPVGGDPHLVAWVEATVWANGAVRYLSWMENGYTKKAGPTNKAATFTLSIGGVQREQFALDIKHHQRPVLSSGSKTHHWVGNTDRSTMIRHDVEYAVSTRILPPYMSEVRQPAFDDNNKFDATSTSHRALISSYQPGIIGNFTYDEDNMANTGYQCSIGLLPTHDAAYIICNTQFDLLYKAVVFNGYAIGRYSIFRRDENTNRPPSIVTHATLVLHDSPNGENVGGTGQSEDYNTTPAVTGGAAASWDVAHSPRAGLMAFLLTGEKFHLETTQAVFTTNWLSINSVNQRAGVHARFTPDYGAVQTRQAAWGMNSLANAATVMPDSDPMKAEYIGEIEKHINYFHATYAVGGNPFGIIEPGEEYQEIVPGHQAVSPWQQDFVTASYGHLLAQDLSYANSTTKTKLKEFFFWKAQTIIGRLNGYGGYVWENFAAFYRISIGTQGLANYYPNKTGFLPNWAAVYAESATPNYAWTSSTPGLIGTEFGPSADAGAMVGNAQPGLAYAVDEGVPGALTAYQNMTSASNWPAILNGFKKAPVWAMAPLTEGVPTVVQAPPSIRLGQMRPNSITLSQNPGVGVPKSSIALAVNAAFKSPAEIHSEGMPPETELLTIIGQASSGNAIVYEDQSIAWTGIADGVQTLPYVLWINGVPNTGTIQANVGTIVVVPDTVGPVMQGVLTKTNVTSSSFDLSWSAAVDNVSVAGYEVSEDNGQSYTGVGNVQTVHKAGKTAATSYQMKVRAYDPSNNRGAPLSLTVTTSSVVVNPGTPVYPPEDEVALGVQYGPTGVEFTGTYAGGTGTGATAAQIAAAVWAYPEALNIPNFLAIK